MLGQLKRNANTWFELALGRAPMELQSTLQVFSSSFLLYMNLTVCERNTLQSNKASAGINSAELGASIAEQFGKSIGPVHRQLRMC